jgi:MFS family permease
VAAVAGLVALSYIPHTWKFSWAPIVDTTLTRKKWYMIGSVMTAIGIFATGAMPATQASLVLLSVLVVTSNFGCTLLGMASESLMAYGSSDEEKGRAGGWFQAGNLGGSGLGGGLGLVLAQRLPSPWLSGAIVGGLCLVCAAALLFIEEPPHAHRAESIGKSLLGVGQDLWSLARSRTGFLAMVLCFLPIGSGAASGVWSAVAGDWHASANAVAIATGLMSGVVSAAGCLVGGWFCDRMDRKTAYATFGALQAAGAVAMAVMPRTETMFVVFTSVYAFMTGLTYAGFSAFTLEAIGLGAAATKYNVLASLSNFPIAYMTSVDGWAHTRWGAGGMLWFESACCLLGLGAFLSVAAVARRFSATAPAAAPVPEAEPA